MLKSHEEYYFFIEYPNGGQEGRTRLWIDTNDDYKYSNMLINEKEIKGDILFKPYYKVSIGYFFNELIDRISIYSHIQNFNLIFYVLSIFLVFLFFVVFLKLVNIKKIKIT